MRNVAKPLWVEGFDLDPIHLQYVDAYHEQVVQGRFAASMPNAWGVLAFELDADALRTGTVRITRFDAVLRDGTLVRTGGDGADVLPERVLDDGAARSERLEIYVTLPQLLDGQPNVDRMVTFDEPRRPEEGASTWTARMLPARPDSDGAPPVRFTSRIVDLTDEANGHETLRVPCTHYALRIAFGSEPRDRCEAVKVAELVRGTSGALALNESFVPPLLRVGVSRFIVAGMQNVLSAMITRQQGLALGRRQRSAARIEAKAADIDRFMFLQALNQKLPSIAEIVSKPETHPATAYRELAELVGLLCTFDVEATPMDIPRFDHLAPGPVFTKLFDMAAALLGRLLAEHFVQIPLEPQQDYSVGALRDPALLQRRFYLAVTGNYDVALIRENVPKYMKVASAHSLPSIVNSAVTGIRLVPEDYPPGALPVRPGVLFFRLEPTQEQWNDIVAAGTIAIHFNYEGFDLALYAVNVQR